LGFSDVSDYAAGKADWFAAGLPSEGKLASEPRIGSLARTDAPTCRLDETVGDARDRARLAGWNRCWVVSAERILFGQLREKELATDPSTRVEAAMLPGPSTFRPNVSVHEMFHRLAEFELSFIPITSSGGRLLGVALPEDVTRAWSQLEADEA
jgi:CBS domain-containing protein